MTHDVGLVKHSTEFTTLCGRNHALFILHVTVQRRTCVFACCYVVRNVIEGVWKLHIFVSSGDSPVGEDGGLGSRNTGKIWLVSWVLLHLSANRKIHDILMFSSKNQVTILQFLESSVTAFWTIFREWRPMAVLLKSFQLCRGCRSVPPFQGGKPDKMIIVFGHI